MKKLVLIAGAAALVLPTASYAKTYKTDNHTVTYHKADSSWNNRHVDNNGYRVEVQSEQDFRSGPRTATSYVTVEGDTLIIDDNSVYKTTANNSARFYASTGSYLVRGGQTIVVEDGQLKRIEQPAEVVVMDTYSNKRHR